MKRSNQDGYTRAKNNLRGAVGQTQRTYQLHEALKFVKKEAPCRAFPELLAFASTSSKFQQVIPLLRKFDHPFAMKRGPTLGVTSIERELAWSFALLQTCVERLHSYVISQRAYFEYLLQSNNLAAAEVLNKIEKENGWSFWLIENRIALINLTGGFEAQKSYVTEFILKAPNSFVSFFATQVSERNEESVELSSYFRRFNTRSQNYWS